MLLSSLSQRDGYAYKDFHYNLRHQHFRNRMGAQFEKNCPLESVKVGLVEMVIQASEKDDKRILEYANNWKKGTSPVITGANL